MATYNIRTTSVQDWRDTMMSKAEFNAVAAERRANRAGSGFDEFGKHVSAYINSLASSVNEGMWVYAGTANNVGLGRSSGSDSVGTSKTDFPYACINGVNLKIDKLLLAHGYDITLPPAPTVLPSTATLTQQQIDSGVIKHADASNSGLIVNGKFDTDTVGWTLENSATAIYTVTSGVLSVNRNSAASAALYQSIPTIIGKKYTIEFYIQSISVGTVSMYDPVTSTQTYYTTTGRKVYEFTASATVSNIKFGATSSTTAAFSIDNIAVFPADAISRSDLVFLESWHEDISEKGFVYPLGNVQYLGTTGDAGTTVAGAFAGAVTYSLFSDTWQADSALVGKGYVWSTLSDANKKAFVANPENNCYLDGDKVIQVRYRMRVVMGWGDSWYNPFSANYVNTNLNSFLSYINTGSAFVKSKGGLVSSADYSTYGYGFRTNGSSEIFENGCYVSNTYSASESYTDKVRALPIALVHRRNQGFNHPVYNPNGTKLASDGNKWYNTAVSFTSIADTMTDTNLTTASGYIGTTSARADGIFFDQIHEGDILDLRNSSQKVEDYNRLIDREFNKAVAGTTRGIQGELNTEVKTQTTTGTVATVEVNDGTRYKSGDVIYIYDLTASAIKGRYTVKSISTNTITVDTTFAKLANSYMISGGSTTRTKSNTITMTDLIGNPANLPASMKLDGQSFNTLHTAEDGTSLLPTGTTGSDGLATFKVSRKANAAPLQVLKSTDSGATWTALTVTTHYTFNTTTNAITFTAGNIPLVAHLIMVVYQTHTNMATPTVNSGVVNEGKVFLLDGYLPSMGATLLNTLIGKVATLSSNHTHPYRTPLSGISLDTSTNTILHYNTQMLPSHLPLPYYQNSSYNSVKVFPYLTRSNGKAYLNLVFKEMKYGSYAAPTVVTAASATYTINMTYKINIAGCALYGKVIQWTAATTTVAVDWSLYDVSPTGVIYLLSSGAVYANARLYDGDSWGDDNKFNIVDNVSTTTDTNGATVLIGQKRVELPYFIGASE